jgi:CRP-like cAMP-binding protein
MIAGLPARERGAVLELAAERTFPPDALLLDDARRCLFVEQGLASLHVPVGDHLSGSVGLIGPGGLLGLPSLMGYSAPVHQAVAVTRSRVVVILTADLHRLLGGLPVLRRLLSAYVNHRFMQALAASACNLEHGLGPRLSDWVLQASGLLGEAVIPVTHDKLASILGATRPSITLALQSLEEGKLIRSRRGHVEVLDAGGLRARACGCGSGTRWVIPRPSAQRQEAGRTVG